MDFIAQLIALIYYVLLVYGLSQRTGFDPVRVIVGIFCVQSLTGSLFYLFDGVSIISLVSAALIPFLGFLIKINIPCKTFYGHFGKLNVQKSFIRSMLILKCIKQDEEKTVRTQSPRFLKFSYALVILFELVLLANLFLNRTTEPSPSPWLLLGPSFFFLYFTATILVMVTAWLAPSNSWRYNLTSLHLFTTWSVAAIMYPLGFGFDGQIHRVTEEWIKLHGFITPKLPLYIGQYTFVIFLSHITKLSASIIDIWLIPIAAAFILPRIISQSLATFFAVSERVAVNLVWLLPFVYFFALFLTTPFNVLILLTIIGIFSGLIFAKTNLSRDFIVPGLSALAGLFIHPLLGAPLALFTAALFIFQKIDSQKIKNLFLILYGILMTFLVPCMFMAFIYFTRGIIPVIANPFVKINLFLDYWRTPFWYQENAPWYFEMLYYWEWLIPVVAVALSLYGLYKVRHKINSLYLITAVSLWVSAFFLRSWVIFPDVHALEQGDYPLRLLKSGILFILPFGMAGLYFFGKNLFDRVYTNAGLRRLTFLFFIICAGALMISFYLTYPQWNPKVQFPGYNVSAADIAAVRWIQNDADGQDYIVLSNPITAVAALKEFSFAKYFKTNQGELFYYSIPSGGVMYSFYTEMWTNGQKRETMERAMNLAGVKRAYFVLPDYWTRFDSIVAGAKKSSDRWVTTENGKIWKSSGSGKIMVFVYEN